MISLTDTAAKYFRSFLDNNPNLTGILIGIKRVGCGGLTYDVQGANVNDLVDTITISTEQDISIYIPNDVLPQLIGSKLDYIKNGLNYTLSVKNPNSKFTCGCGQSFSVE